MKDFEFETANERERSKFQSYINALLEAHADLLHKISQAKGARKSGIWIELSEAEIISGHILECCANLMVPFQNIVDANRLLFLNNSAMSGLMRSNLRQSVEDFKGARISKEELKERIDAFVDIPKLKVAR